MFGDRGRGRLLLFRVAAVAVLVSQDGGHGGGGGRAQQQQQPLRSGGDACPVTHVRRARTVGHLDVVRPGPAEAFPVVVCGVLHVAAVPHRPNAPVNYSRATRH